jgi:thymidylate kinase
MKKVEFLGAPGIGKTTIIKELISCRKKNDKYISLGEAKNIILKRNILNKIYQPKSLLKLVILKYGKLLGLTEKYYDDIIGTLSNSSGNSNYDEFRPFLKCCDKLLRHSEDDPIYRLLTTRWLLISLDEYINLNSIDLNYTVIIDEFVTHKSIGILSSSNSFEDKHCKEYFSLVPTGDLVIYLYAEPKIIMERIIQRRSERITYQHRGLSESQILEKTTMAVRIVEMGAEILKERGVNVVKIDGTNTIARIVNDIKKHVILLA